MIIGIQGARVKRASPENQHAVRHEFLAFPVPFA